MLIIRVVLLLYFVAPARKPIFGILLVWFAYELWQRGIFNNRPLVLNVQPRDVNPAPPQQEPQPAGAAGPVPDAAGAGAANNNIPARDQRRPQPGAQPNPALEHVSTYNLEAEEAMLSGNNAEEPGIWQKAITFVGLLIATIHPAVWDRRRELLRRREGTIRTEEAARRDDTEDENETIAATRAARRAQLIALHERRPRWIQNYVERVVAGEWVEETD